MGLRDDIELELQKTVKKKDTKRDKILRFRDDVEYMLSKKISLNKQIDLLVKNEIIEGIDLKYYRDILKNDFNYKTVKNKKNEKKINAPVKKTNNTKITKTDNAIDVLSQDIELKF